jgi:hypothetical protein
MSSKHEAISEIAINYYIRETLHVRKYVVSSYTDSRHICAHFPDNVYEMRVMYGLQGSRTLARAIALTVS